MAPRTQALSSLDVKMDLHSMGFTFAKGGGGLYVYRDGPGHGGLYRPADEFIRNVLASRLGHGWKRHHVDSVTAKVEGQRSD